MSTRFPLIALATLAATALAACDNRTKTAPVAETPPAVTEAASVPDPTAVPANPAAAASAAALTHFKANGFSPAWEVEVNGTQMQLSVPAHDDPDGKLRPVTVTRTSHASGSAYDGKDGSAHLTLEINDGPCVRTGEPREYIATLRYGKETMHGCADRVAAP